MRNNTKAFSKKHTNSFSKNISQNKFDIEEWNGNYCSYIQFKQIDKFDLIPNAIEALTPFEISPQEVNPMELDEVKFNHDDRMHK